jgi:hypothetical protein
MQIELMMLYMVLLLRMYQTLKSITQEGERRIKVTELVNLRSRSSYSQLCRASGDIRQAVRAGNLLVRNIPAVEVAAGPVEAPVATSLQIGRQAVATCSARGTTVGIAPRNTTVSIMSDSNGTPSTVI